MARTNAPPAIARAAVGLAAARPPPAPIQGVYLRVDCAAFYFIVATFGYFLMPLYAQVVLGLSPFSAGLLIVPL